MPAAHDTHPSSASPLPLKLMRAAALTAAAALAVTACGDAATLASPAPDASSASLEEKTPSPTPEEDSDLPSNDDLKAYVEAVGGASIRDLDDAEELVVEGSPAHAYLTHIRHLHEAERDAGFPIIDSARVLEVEEGFEMCYPLEDECLGVFRDFTGEDGRIFSFSIDDRPMDDSILMGDGSRVEGPHGIEVELITAYENVRGTHLFVNYTLHSGSVGIHSPLSSYRSTSGRQSESDQITGAWELLPDSMSHYTDAIAGAEIGGELHLDLHDVDTYDLWEVTVPVRSE